MTNPLVRAVRYGGRDGDCRSLVALEMLDGYINL